MHDQAATRNKKKMEIHGKILFANCNPTGGKNINYHNVDTKLNADRMQSYRTTNNILKLRHDILTKAKEMKIVVNSVSLMYAFSCPSSCRSIKIRNYKSIPTRLF
jgi:hypothetical protein